MKDGLHKLLSLLPTKGDKNPFYVGLRAISQDLESGIKAIKDDYSTISFIGHSMGGAILKKSLIFLKDHENSFPFFL